MIVVDTSVWSALLRRRQIDESDPWVAAFRQHFAAGESIILLGPVLQELLDSIRRPDDFDRVKAALEQFPLLDIDRDAYVFAAQLSNRCRAAGLATGTANALIAGVCIRGDYALLTADRDFLRIAEHSPLIVLPPLA